MSNYSKNILNSTGLEKRSACRRNLLQIFNMNNEHSNVDSDIDETHPNYVTELSLEQIPSQKETTESVELQNKEVTVDNDIPVYADLHTMILDDQIIDSSINECNEQSVADSIQNQDYNNSFTNECNEQSVIDSIKNQDYNSYSSTNITRKSNQMKKKYLDYISDEDILLENAFRGDDSDIWQEEYETSSSENEIIKKKKKKTQKQIPVNSEEQNFVGEFGSIQKKQNKREIKKRAKQAGQEYEKKSGVIVAAKKLQPNPCSGRKCGNDCGSVTEEKRNNIFKHFWNLTLQRRKDWLVTMSQKIPIKRRRSKEPGKRNYTYKYYINEGEGKRSVCLQFMCKTLDVSQKYIYYTLSNSDFGSSKEDMRGKCIPPNKTKESTKQSVINFIKNLPALPSHYCRKDSNRVYLPQEFKNVSNLYQIYKKRYLEEGIDIVGEKVFKNIFSFNFNIGFHIPKKDKCIKCLKFEHSDNNDPFIQQEKKAHIDEKIHTYNRFKVHQNIHKTDPTTLCVSFDLEKVLNTPHGESMLLYYSRKISVYNLCFYESGTRNGFCYYWDEMNGKRGANEIATILNRYILMVDERRTVENLLLYCDSCPDQNRNRTVLAMIHATLQNCQFIQVIQLNFLLTGHTYMPVDSIHAVIDRSIKNSIIWAPSQWFTVFATARQDPKPYEVELLSYTEFKKWDLFGEKYFKGNLIGKTSKIRVATFKKKNLSVMSIKYSMDDSAPNFVIDIQSKAKLVSLNPSYKSLLPISKPKYDDLVKLCKDKVIPPLFHREYENIPISSNIKDTLPETDLEDEDEAIVTVTSQ